MRTSKRSEVKDVQSWDEVPIARPYEEEKREGLVG